MSQKSFSKPKGPKFNPPTLFINHTYFACLGLCLLIVSNKQQNGITNWAQFLHGTSHDPRKGFFLLMLYIVHREEIEP